MKSWVHDRVQPVVTISEESKFYAKLYLYLYMHKNYANIQCDGAVS